MRRASAFALAAFAAPSVFSCAFAQEIVVTGERRDQNAREIAGGVAVLNSVELARVDAQAPNEALNRLPGVAIHRNNGVENLPAIRSPVLVGGQSAGSFLILEDGVPIRAPGFSNVNSLFETSLDFAERVEVVRGPGSALYGSNAVHGIVNVLTPRAGASMDRAAFNASIGSFDRQSLSAIAYFGAREGAVDDPQVGYVGVSASHEGGWRAASPSDQQQALIGFDSYLGDWNLEARIFAQNVNQESAGFIQGARAYDSTAIARSNPVPEAYRDAQLLRARATLSRAWGDYRFTLTPYARSIEGDLNLFFFPSRAQELSEQQGGGAQATLYWDPNTDVSLIFGADGDFTRGSLWEFQRLADQPNGYLQGLHYDYDVDMRTLALYMQANWRLAANWRLIAGLRGEEVRYDYTNNAPNGDFGRFRRPADRTDEFGAVTPKLGLVWTPDEAGTFWINLARGARAQQITDLYSLQTTQTPGEQDVETLDSAELGWRGAIGAARVEIALYHMDKRDTSFRNADGFTVTDGKTRHEGVELSGAMPLTEDLEFAGWITYAAHTYQFDDPVTRAGESISKGDDVDSAPRWISNARLLWRPLQAVSAELEWVHMGEYFTNAANTNAYTGHDIFNLRADWEVRDGLTLFGAVRNVTNTDYAERADFAFGNDRYFPGEDRGYTIGLRARR